MATFLGFDVDDSDMPFNEFAYDPDPDRDLQAWERDWYETYRFEPEEMER